MATRIQVRRDTLANWNSFNPTLSSGEIAFVTDQNKIKIGDGATAFTALEYLEADAFVDSVALGTDTTGDYVETLIASDGISISGEGAESASVTVTNTGVLSLAGTTNEIEVSAASGNITLSLPTSITVDLVGDVTGNADTASALATARNISLGGDVSGSASFNGGADITIAATVADDSHNHIIANVDGLQTALDNNASSASAVASDLTNHENATTSVHGIADTSSLATTSYVDTAESDAVATANAYSDSLATNYDSAGSASAVASDLTDHENATTSVHGIADTSALATKTYADNAASTAAANLVDSAPGTLDTLNELAAALGDDPNFATTVTNSIAGKQPLDADLTAIAALTGTSGFLKKTAADTWSLDTNTYLTGNQTITLSGDVSGSGTTSIEITVLDDSHNHIIGNVDGLQDALDLKLNSSEYTASDVLTKIKTVDGSTSGLDSDLLDGQDGSYYLDWTNTTNKPDPTITLGGDASGSLTLTNLAGGTLSLTLANSGVTADTYGGSTQVPVITVDSKGRLTSVSTAAIVSLPSQTGNDGKYLTTDGTNASWATVEAGLNPFLLVGV